MQRAYVRTDLAAEASTRLSTPTEGVEAQELTINNCKVSSVTVTSKAGANAIGKPEGKYLTLEMEEYVNRRAVSFADCANALAELLRGFEAVSSANTYMIACLGNRAVTPDAVGPATADSILVTRHLKSSLPEEFAAFSSVAVLRTGVLGTTGIESAQAVKSMCELIAPDCVIVVDALASGEVGRLCRNIQICDTGISPGSGVGNDRAAINADFLGRPVIAVGLPTVVDAAAFTDDEAAKGLFVTPRNIDELVKSVSKLIAYGINLAVHRGLCIEDVDMLIE